MTLRFVTELEEYTEMLTYFSRIDQDAVIWKKIREKTLAAITIGKHLKDLQNQQLDDPEIGEEIEWFNTHIGQAGTIHPHAAQV